MRKFEKQYKQYVKRVKSPKTIGGVFYPNGFGEPCTYKQWLKTQRAEKIAMRKFNELFK